jgi:hypothetical protein
VVVSVFTSRLDKSGIKLSNNNKLGNILGVSRSFGDYSFKRPVNKGLIVDPDYFEIKCMSSLAPAYSLPGAHC